MTTNIASTIAFLGVGTFFFYLSLSNSFKTKVFKIPFFLLGQLFIIQAISLTAWISRESGNTSLGLLNDMGLTILIYFFLFSTFGYILSVFFQAFIDIFPKKEGVEVK